LYEKQDDKSTSIINYLNIAIAEYTRRAARINDIYLFPLGFWMNLFNEEPRVAHNEILRNEQAASSREKRKRVPDLLK